MTTPANELPFVNLAAFCENVLTEADNVQSAIRVIDQITHVSIGSDPTEKMPPFQRVIWYLLILRAGGVTGEHEISLELYRTDGTVVTLLKQTAEFEGDEKGVSFALQIGLEVKNEGLVWLRSYFDGTPLSSSPLRITYQTAATLPE